MKQFIVLLAVLPVLMVFVLQLPMEQKHSQTVARIQDAVYTAKEEAKQEGYFSEEIKDRLRSRLSRVTGAKPSEILIRCDPGIKTRYGKGTDRLICYRVEVPVRHVMAAPAFFGMSGKENSIRYVIDSYTASERL